MLPPPQAVEAGHSRARGGPPARRRPRSRGSADGASACTLVPWRAEKRERGRSAVQLRRMAHPPPTPPPLPPLEPQLLVPAELTQRALAALKAARAIAAHWQVGGRYGSRIAAEVEPDEGARPRRTIPVLAAAADAISACLAAAHGGVGGVGGVPDLPSAAAAALPDELLAVLRSHSSVALRYLPRTAPRAPRAELLDARVHPERAPSGVGDTAHPSPAAVLRASSRRSRQTEQSAAFTFVELFAGLGVRAQHFNSSVGRQLCRFSPQLCALSALLACSNHLWPPRASPWVLKPSVASVCSRPRWRRAA